MWLVRSALSLVGPRLVPKFEVLLVINQSWPFGANCYRSRYLASWIVSKREQSGFLRVRLKPVWLPGFCVARGPVS